MHNTNEQRLDIIKNCDVLLKKFPGYESIDSTPEGRMIAQLTWLKERAENHDLPLPVPQEKLSTLRYIYTDGTLNFHASNPKDRECVYWEMEIPMRRLIRLALHGDLLIKDEYLSYIPRCIDALAHLLNKAPRPLHSHELEMAQDMIKLRDLLLANKIKLPLKGYMPDYKSFIKPDSSLKDMKSIQTLFRVITDLVFNGVRPNSWLTPEDAEREVQGYFSLE